MAIKKLYELQIGDRFYFAHDKRRHVWQVDYIEYDCTSTYMPWVKYNRYHLISDDKKVKKETIDYRVVWIRKVS